jgi:hypothetical protein
MAFRTRYSYFKYLIISFRLANILAIFQAYINIILIRLLNYFVVIYLNNILIYFRNKDKYYNYIY